MRRAVIWTFAAGLMIAAAPLSVRKKVAVLS